MHIQILISWICTLFKINYSFFDFLIDSIAGFVFFFQVFFSHFCIFLLFLHLCNRNSLSGNVNIFKREFFIFLFFLHLLNRNSSAGLVHFFKINFVSIFFNFPIASTICRRSSLAGLGDFCC